MPPISAIACSNVVLTSPTLPPNAIRALAMSGRMPVAGQDHADVLEDRGNWGMRLMHCDLDRADARKRCEDGVCDRTGRALQKPVVGVLERRSRGRNHVGI